MILFSGFGFLPVLFLIFFALGSVNHAGPAKPSELALAFFLTGLASGVLGWWLQRRPARIVTDKATGKELAIRRSHSLFFIPMFYWGPIFFAMSVYELVQMAIRD